METDSTAEAPERPITLVENQWRGKGRGGRGDRNEIGKIALLKHGQKKAKGGRGWRWKQRKILARNSPPRKWMRARL